MPFRRRHRLYDNFALYGGRVEPGSGCEEMLDYFDTFANSHADDVRLVLMGVKMMTVPEAPYLRLAGVLPDRERMTAYEAASITIAPGDNDLLSQSLLESLAVGTPVSPTPPMKRPSNTVAGQTQGCTTRIATSSWGRSTSCKRRRCANGWARTDVGTSAITINGTR